VVGVHLRRLYRPGYKESPAKTALQFRHNGRDVAVFVTAASICWPPCAMPS